MAFPRIDEVTGPDLKQEVSKFNLKVAGPFLQALVKAGQEWVAVKCYLCQWVG